MLYKWGDAEDKGYVWLSSSTLYYNQAFVGRGLRFSSPLDAIGVK